MSLTLPHVEAAAVLKTTKICITDGGTHGLIVLSDNNELARCPASNIRESGNELTFDLVCEGHNRAVAWAKYRLSPDGFIGTVDMKMGHKNMTLTERQRGKRIGVCSETPHS